MIILKPNTHTIMKKLIQPFGLLAMLLLLIAGWAYNLFSNIEVYDSRTGTAEITVLIQTHKTETSSEKRKFKTTLSLNDLRAGAYKLGAASYSKDCKSINTNRDINIEVYDTTSVKLRLQCDTMPKKLWNNRFVFMIQNSEHPVLYQLNKQGAEMKLLDDLDLFHGQTKNESKIAFTKDGNIWLLNTTDESIKKLTRNGSDREPDWSPDGTKITFSRTVEGNQEIFIMDGDGTSKKNITQHPGDDTAPDWSPDGLKIAFTSDRDGDKEIFVTYPKTNNTRQLTDNTYTDHSASWLPDGRKIVLIAEGWMGMEHVYLTGFNGRRLKQLTSFPQSLFRDVALPDLITSDDIKYSKESLLSPEEISPFRSPKEELLAQLADM